MLHQSFLVIKFKSLILMRKPKMSELAAHGLDKLDDKRTVYRIIITCIKVLVELALR